MKITYLCHSSFLLEDRGLTVLVDPFFVDEKETLKKYPNIKNPDFILASHGHDDHIGSAFSVGGEKTVVVGIFELCSLFASRGFKTVGMNIGGTVNLAPGLTVTMVKADHSGSFEGVYTGEPAGFVITLGGKTIYFSGDTSVFGDMKLIEEFYHPTVGLLCVGGHFTADMAAMAYACNNFFNFDLVIPMHYNTFPPITVDISKFPPLLEKTAVKILAPLEQMEI